MIVFDKFGQVAWVASCYWLGENIIHACNQGCDCQAKHCPNEARRDEVTSRAGLRLHHGVDLDWSVHAY